MARAMMALLALLSAGLLAFAGGCTGAGTPPALEPVTINGETFMLEVADDENEIAQGLMGRSELPEEGGMLFIFPSAEMRSFWMGHCLIDIDIIFLDAHGRVTATHRMKAQPPKRPEETDARYRARMPGYSSVRPAQFAIELKAGWLDRLNVRVDDRIELDLERLKARATGAY